MDIGVRAVVVAGEVSVVPTAPSAPALPFGFFALVVATPFAFVICGGPLGDVLGVVPRSFRARGGVPSVIEVSVVLMLAFACLSF